jgi:plastocyanin
MSIFKIVIKAGKPAVFDPNPLTAQVNDSVYWYNSDQTQAHWPAPSASNPKGWLDYQIAPDGVSSQISLNPPAPYTLKYVCALHPGETGQIKVIGKKGAFGGKTKKGPFGGKTKKGPFGGKTKKGPFGGNTKKGAFGRKTK